MALSYTVGAAGPVSVRVRAFGSGEHDDQTLQERLLQAVDLRLGAIVRDFGLIKLPSPPGDGYYRKLACYGHMGRTDLQAPWENTEKAAKLK